MRRKFREDRSLSLVGSVGQAGECVHLVTFASYHKSVHDAGDDDEDDYDDDYQDERVTMMVTVCLLYTSPSPRDS